MGLFILFVNVESLIFNICLFTNNRGRASMMKGVNNNYNIQYNIYGVSCSCHMYSSLYYLSILTNVATTGQSMCPSFRNFNKSRRQEPSTSSSFAGSQRGHFSVHLFVLFMQSLQCNIAISWFLIAWNVGEHLLIQSNYICRNH